MDAAFPLEASTAVRQSLRPVGGQLIQHRAAALPMSPTSPQSAPGKTKNAIPNHAHLRYQIYSARALMLLLAKASPCASSNLIEATSFVLPSN